ncbi:MAG: hypothetical protein OXU61_00580, partial [Gammaproteobacteria bacterium]|nr:hypothetical protein [Gammaproteobacteria bacterium]
MPGRSILSGRDFCPHKGAGAGRQAPQRSCRQPAYMGDIGGERMPETTQANAAAATAAGGTRDSARER